MGLRALLYAYLLGGITFIPLVIAGFIFITIYTSEPVDPTANKLGKKRIIEGEDETVEAKVEGEDATPLETDDLPRTRKGWLTVRRTFEESPTNGSYVGMMRSFLDSRSKDPKRSRPKDTWYVVLKGKVLYLYEDESMVDCGAVIELGGHDVVIYPEALLDGELFTKRNAICLKPKAPEDSKANMPSLTKEMKLSEEDEAAQKVEQAKEKGPASEKLAELEKKRAAAARDQALDTSTPWFIFVKSCTEMEDWYSSLVHASDNPAKTPYLVPVEGVFKAADMNHLVTTLDEQPDVIPTRWLNALIGRIFFSFYRTDMLESYFVGRLMKKLSKVKRPNFLTDIVVTEVNVGNRAPSFSKPMLKELTKEGDAAMEVHFHYKGEFRITIEATATINIGAFNKSYVVKLALAAVIREIEGNLLVKLKRPPSNRIWYAFTQTPKMVINVEPIVSDRQITWGMILSTIESKLKEIIQESVVMPNMDDIAFFDSQPYAHRGGIWTDASRKEGPRVHTPAPDVVPNDSATQAESTAVDDVQSTISAPTVDVSPPVEEKVVPVQTSHSAEELTTSSPPVIAYSLSEEPTTSAPTEPEPSEPVRSKTDPARRRSWFSSIRSDKAGLQATDNEDEADDEQRGRARSVNPEANGTIRSRSTTTNPDVKVEDVDEDDGQSSTIADEDRVIPRTPKRSASAHSTKSTHSKTTSIDSSISAPDSTTTARSSNTQTSPSSFLSTLKSRGVDKQALSNTAREAMRKWSVNWGLKKDTSENTSEDSDRGSIGSTISSRLRSDNNQTIAQKARASYAEVRAAVEERKNRPNGSSDDGSDVSRSSSPIPIPNNTRNRALSIPSQDAGLVPPGPSSFPESVALSSSSGSSNGHNLRPGQAENGATPKPSAPAARSMTETDAQDAISKPPSIVHVQPKGKTMTIPGIHACHRGEIMSMGYNAPPPPSVAPADNKLLRLFKTPILSDQQQNSGASTEPLSADNQQEAESQKPEEDSALATPKVLSPVPPPLPPRTAAATSGVTLTDTNQAARQPSPPNSTASEALRTIASKDGFNRAAATPSPSVDGQVGNGVSGDADLPVQDGPRGDSPAPTSPIRNPGPPLPPRRSSTINTSA